MLLHAWRGLLRPLLAVLLAGWFGSAGATPYLDELVARAQVRQLHERAEWLALLHYQPRFRVMGLRSMADSPAFFNAPDGARNPAAELRATLAAFFSDRPETDRQQNPQCLFIARYHWLKQELGFDPARLPERPCVRFSNWRTSLNPRSVALVFPAAYLNNPASMYGHTLLRIDSEASAAGSPLLSYAINYAAATDETNGILFAVRGLVGGYDGGYSIAPYYAKVSEYNDLENRDIWEYELALSPAEIDRLLMHVWELAQVKFDYYFIDENCAYQLLSLLDVARPALRLVDRFPLMVIPGDTVRAVAQEPGLVRNVTFRAARSSILSQRRALLSEPELELARTIATPAALLAQPALTELAPERRAQVLDLAFEYLEYRRLRGEVPNASAAPRLRALLAERSKVDAPDLPPPPPPAVRPEQGHDSARLALGAGGVDGQGFQELRLRPGYHDLLNAPGGYIHGAQIEFLDLAVRRASATGEWQVEQFTIADVVSLAPRDALLKPWSWRLHAGLRRMDLADRSRPLVGELHGGSGLTWALAGGSLSYAFAEGSLLTSSALAQHHSAGLGGAAGLLLDPHPDWRIHTFGRKIQYVSGEQHARVEAGFELRWTRSRNSALRLETRWTRAYEQDRRSALLLFDLHL